MGWFDRALILFCALGFWALLGYYVSISRPAVSQDFYYEVQEAVNDCVIFGRVRQDQFGAHRMDAKIDCGPSWVHEGAN